MERDELSKISTEFPEGEQDNEFPDDPWEVMARDACQPIREQNLLAEFRGDRKRELLSSYARDIAKSVALDGTLTNSDRAELQKAFQQAFEIGCEKDLVKAINQTLKDAGSNKRVVLDTRPLWYSYMAIDRELVVLNADEGKVTDSHKFEVRERSNAEWSEFRPARKTERPPEVMWIK